MNEELSSIFEKLNINKESISSDMIENLVDMFNNSTSSSSSTTSDIDMDTIIKIKTMIDKMSTKKDDPRSNLLNSLRPYLKQSRQSKLDQYIQLMNMSKIIDILPYIGGENNGNK